MLDRKLEPKFTHILGHDTNMTYRFLIIRIMHIGPILCACPRLKFIMYGGLSNTMLWKLKIKNLCVFQEIFLSIEVSISSYTSIEIIVILNWNTTTWLHSFPKCYYFLSQSNCSYFPFRFSWWLKMNRLSRTAPVFAGISSNLNTYSKWPLSTKTQSWTCSS